MKSCTNIFSNMRVIYQDLSSVMIVTRRFPRNVPGPYISLYILTKPSSSVLCVVKVRDPYYLFYTTNIPFSVETLGPWSCEIVHKRSAFFTQRISLAIQRGNSAAVMGTLLGSSYLEEVFCVIGRYSFKYILKLIITGHYY
jgi:hypothetical protein